MARPYPMIEYAHQIGKNTADFTVSDMIKFTKWWVQQEMREDLLKMTPEQREAYNEDVKKMKQWRGEQDMSKNSQKMKNAATSRLPKQLDDELVGDSEIMDNMDNEEEVPAGEIVCSMELTKADVDALLFAITRVFEDYEMEGHEYGESLASLKEGLEGV